MKKVVCIVLLLMLGINLLSGVLVSSVSADENYNDYSNEYSESPGVSPEGGQTREGPRTRFKDV
ncbi:hypothetical protein JW865_00485 [Candidatus Bathyarchaeota archaeon]|nr:hypothetical protein [Candidatus Bathyarchaeota archaeon]